MRTTTTEMPAPLTPTQLEMMSLLTDNLCASFLAGDLTRQEAAEVLRRLLDWLQEMEHEAPGH